MSVADELQKLQQLRDSGAIDDAEFAAAKAKILNPPAEDHGLFASNSGPLTAEELDRKTRSCAALLHLSMLLGYTGVPILGLVAPIVIWQVKKDELPGLDEHGRNATNWIISSIIYAVISGLLVLVFVGIPMLIGLLVCSLVFPIIAAAKANDGVAWKYPCTIEFLRSSEKW